MKTALVFIAACALICSACAAPVDSDDVELIRDLIGRAVRSQDDMTTAEMQGWLSSAWNKAKNYVKNNRKSLLKAGGRALSKYSTAEVQRGNERAREQFHVHLYNDDANQLNDRNAAEVQRGNERAREQFHVHLYKDDINQLNDRNAAEVQRGNERAKEQFHVHLYDKAAQQNACLLYTSPSPRDATLSRMPSSA